MLSFCLALLTFSVTLTLDRVNPPTITADLENMTLVAGTASFNTLTSAIRAGYNCGPCQIIVTQPTTATLASKFSTVTTGISSGKYYFVSVSLANYGNYFFWVKA
jgi:hypothetical protein